MLSRVCMIYKFDMNISFVSMSNMYGNVPELCEIFFVYGQSSSTLHRTRLNRIESVLNRRHKRILFLALSPLSRSLYCCLVGADAVVRRLSD